MYVCHNGKRSRTRPLHNIIHKIMIVLLHRTVSSDIRAGKQAREDGFARTWALAFSPEAAARAHSEIITSNSLLRSQACTGCVSYKVSITCLQRLSYGLIMTNPAESVCLQQRQADRLRFYLISKISKILFGL